MWSNLVDPRVGALRINPDEPNLNKIVDLMKRFKAALNFGTLGFNPWGPNLFNLCNLFKSALNLGPSALIHGDLIYSMYSIYLSQSCTWGPPT